MPVRIAVLRQTDFTAGQWTAITNNALAFRDLTDAQVSRIGQVFPGTAQQIAQQVVDDAVRRLRAAAKNKGQNDARQAGEATIQADSQAFDAAFLSEWAEV